MEIGSTSSVAVIKREANKKQESPLPRPFPLPGNFHHSVISGLEEKYLVGKARTKFTTAIASAMFQHKSYPTGDEYKHVVQEVFKKWPFLRVRNGDVSVTVILLITPN